MKVVTGDYRPYEQPYRGRAYRISRIFTNNFTILITRWYTILVLALSFMFLFFSIMILIFSSMAEETEEVLMGDALDKVYFQVLPESDVDLHAFTSLNSNLTLRYNVTNVGKNVTTPFMIFLPPNPLWTYSIEYPQEVLEPGSSMVVEVRMWVPDNIVDFGDFSYRPWDGDEPNDDEDDPELKQSSDDPGPILFPSDLIKFDMPTNPFDFFGDSVIYESMFSRLTLFLVAPDDIFRGSLAEGYPVNLDPRIASISTLVTLEKDEPALLSLWQEGRPDMNFSSTFDIGIEDAEGSPFRLEMVSQGTDTFRVIIENTGNISIRIKLEALILPISDPDWFVEVYSDRDHDDNPEGEILPGEEMRYLVKVSSGAFRLKMPYNIVLIGTDINRSEYRESRAVHMVVDIEGESEEKKIEQKFFDTFWGREFNYERFLWFILLTAVCGGGIISTDLKNNTFTLYLSRPLTWIDYAIGKFLALSGILSLITMVPVILVFIVGMAFKDESFTYFLDHLWILGGMLLSFVIAITIFSSLSLALSSLAKRGIYAGIGIFAYFIFTPPVSDLLVELFENNYIKLFNINLVLKNLFKPFYGLSYDSENMGFNYHLLVLVAVLLFVLSWSIIFIRFHNREVAK